jgi:hypothetical protein
MFTELLHITAFDHLILEIIYSSKWELTLNKYHGFPMRMKSYDSSLEF